MQACCLGIVSVIVLFTVLIDDCQGFRFNWLWGGNSKSVKNATVGKLKHEVQIYSDGTVTYKGLKPEQLIESIQFGVQVSLEKLPLKEGKIVVSGNESNVIDTSVCMGENGLFSDFTFLTYSPAFFESIRQIFGISRDDFVKSYCKEEMIEFSNPANSGSLFYLTKNSRFFTKTVRIWEFSALQNMLKDYYDHLKNNPCTLLTKFFGLYIYRTSIASAFTDVRLVIMNNVFPPSVKIHRKYDIKGCLRKASAKEKKKKSPTYQDLDLSDHYPGGFYLQEGLHKGLMEKIEMDTSVMKKNNIIDYSLLVGVHHPEGEHGGQDVNPKRYRDNAVNCPYSAWPAVTRNGSKVVLYIAIIDLVNSWSLPTKTAYAAVSPFVDQTKFDLAPPTIYRKRFLKFLQRVFKPVKPADQKRKQEDANILFLLVGSLYHILMDILWSSS